MRLRATIAYDGTDFRGWAPQPGVRTVGAVLADALGVESVVVAGRTDAGVHAAANVVSFDAERELPAKAVNANLPDDAAVLELSPAGDGFDARADARGRSYVYRINNGQAVDPLRRRFELFHPRRVDDDARDGPHRHVADPGHADHGAVALAAAAADAGGPEVSVDHRAPALAGRLPSFGRTSSAKRAMLSSTARSSGRTGSKTTWLTPRAS